MGYMSERTKEERCRCMSEKPEGGILSEGAVIRVQFQDQGLEW
jgi:hypothetical protein